MREELQRGQNLKGRNRTVTMTFSLVLGDPPFPAADVWKLEKPLGEKPLGEKPLGEDRDARGRDGGGRGRGGEAEEPLNLNLKVVGVMDRTPVGEARALPLPMLELLVLELGLALGLGKDETE